MRNQHEGYREPEYVQPDSSGKGKELCCFTDGASRGNPGPSAGAYILVSREGLVIEERSWFLGTGTNNEAEYQALIAGLKAADRQGCEFLTVFSDSELVVRQMEGSYRVSSSRLRPLYAKAANLLPRFRSVRFRSVPRENPMIRRADRLCNQALDEATGRSI
jgi:ribonuclease HI